MYQGHMPDGSPVQKHSVGDLFPVIIVAYGDGTWQWVDPVRRLAGNRRASHRLTVASAEAYKRAPASALNTGWLRINYEEYLSR